MIDSDPILLKNNLFMFGVYVGSDFNLLYDETYISLRINQTNYFKEKISTKTFQFVNCTYDHFLNINKQLLQKMNINNYLCPESTDLYVMGNGFAENYTFFELLITRCSGTDSKGNPCKSDAEIDKAIDSTTIQLRMINNYFDFDDYNKPIKSFFDDQFFYPLTSGFTKNAYMYIRQNTAEQKDSLFRYQPLGSQTSFISIESASEKFTKINPQKNVLIASFYKDPKSYNYERTVFSFLDCCGLIGGVNEILEVCGKIIVSLFSGKIFAFSILSTLYQVDLTGSNHRKLIVKVMITTNFKTKYPRNQSNKI